MTEVTKLFEELVQLGIKLGTENGSLKISASKGVLTSDLQRRMLENKSELVRSLERVRPAQVGAELAIRADSDSDHTPFPLSDLQLGFYIANDPYMEFHVRPHLYMEMDREGLDVGAYEAAWNKALGRHRREICIVNGDVEMQMLTEPPVMKIVVNDWRRLDTEDAARELLRVREEMSRQELPLTSWPWLDLRVSLWSDRGRNKARIHYNHNSYFIDGFGAALLLAEVDSYCADSYLTVPAPAISFRDAVLALEQLAQSEGGRAAQHYWFSRLAHLPPPPALPQRAGLNRRIRSHLQRREGSLTRAEWESFKAHASANGLTPSNAIIAAYAYVMATWSNSDRFILSQMATRRFSELHPDITRILGNFASLYPLEIQLSAAAAFANNARAIQDQVLRDMKHLQLGGMRVLQELNRLQGSFGSAPSPYVIGSGLFIRKYRKPDFSVLETSQTLLDHQFFELDDGSYFYVWDLLEAFFPDGMVEAMFRGYQHLLRELARSRESWQRKDFTATMLGESPLQRSQNNAAAPVPHGTLHQALTHRAAENGGHAALADPHGTLDYRALEKWSNALANKLSAHGIGRGNLVPIMMDRNRALLPAVMGVLKAGAAYVPIDPHLPAERIAFLLSDVNAVVVLTEPLYEQAVLWPEGVTPICISAPEYSSETNTAAASANDLAYVIYTSGSTGKPKGVMIDHRGALNTVLDINRRCQIDSSDRIFGVSAFNFDLSVYDIFGAVAAGACLIYPQPELALNPAHWVDLVLDAKITIWNSVPALMSLLAETARERGVTLPSLRLVLLSGDKIPLELPEAVRQVAPNAKVVSLGGATEASIWSIFFPIGQVDLHWTTIPYGYPLDHQYWEVRDRHGKPCPVWTPGELYIGGVGVALGYWNDPEKTSSGFPIQAQTGERVYRTGDLGRFWPDGCIEWLGRADFQVKIQGHRIELGEIEAALSEHPLVIQAVVTVQDSPSGHRKRLVAHWVSANEAQPDARELESFLQAKLPAYMVPTAWRWMSQLPLTSNGKVDRKALMQTLLEDDEPRRAQEYRAADGEVETKLQGIWQTVLKLPRIGVTEDFFELGGQSFDAIRIFARVKEELGGNCTLTDMWNNRTIRQLAKRITAAAPTRTSVIVPINRKREGNPLFLVHPAGGSVMAYAGLGHRLSRPLFGIQAVADAVSVIHQRDMKSLARHYIDALRAERSCGPYVLGGWSSGALVAFEMASQLESAGERVSRVFILDGPTPIAHESLDAERCIVWFVQDLALDLSLERLRSETFSGLTSEAQLRKAARILGVEHMPEFDVSQLLPSYEIFVDLILAGCRYTPRKIAADLTVIRVAQNIVEEFASHPCRHESDWGWGAFTTGTVHCVQVPGHHHSFLSEPLVQSWCSLLD